MPKKRFTEGQIVFTLCFFGSNFEIFDPLDFLAAVTSHIPNRGEHLVRYYRSYSSVQRGQRRRQGLGKMPLGPIPLSDETACPKVARGNWARLIKPEDPPVRRWAAILGWSSLAAFLVAAVALLLMGPGAPMPLISPTSPCNYF